MYTVSLIRKMKRGHREVDTKLDNYYQGGKDLVTLGGGLGKNGLIEIYRDSFGGMMMGTNAQIMDDVKNMQNLDLTQAYQNQSFSMPSAFIPASMINARNIPLLAVFSSLWPTTELNFHIVREEWNQIEYTDVAEGGIPDEPTFSTWGWTQKLGKKKQSVTISLNLVLDPQKGNTVWQKNLAVLASDAVLTLLKEVAYTLYMTGWRNLVLENMRATQVTLPLLYQTEASDFMIFALDQSKGFGRIDAIADEIGANNVLMPSNAKEYLNHVKGESVNVNGSIISELDDNKRPMATTGPNSIVTSGGGNNSLNYFQMTPFAVNSRIKEREDPSITLMTICNVYPCDPNIRLDSDVRCTAACGEALDTILFHQTENNGEMRRIPRKELIRACFLFDPITGGPSVHVGNLMDKLNSESKTPWAFEGVSDINNERLDFGYDNPHNGYLKNDPNLRNLRQFRDEFFALTFDPITKKRRIPILEGDYTLSAKPNELFLRGAKLLSLAYEKESGLNLESEISNVHVLLENIRGTPITAQYNYALIDTNLVFLPKDYKGNDFPSNEYGSLRLPGQTSYDINDMIYPPYFDNGPGLYTLSKQATMTGTQWQRAGLEARTAIRFLESFAKFLIRATGGQSEALDATNLNNGLKIKDKTVSAVILLVQSIGGRTTSIDIGIPVTVIETSDDDINKGKNAAPLGDISKLIRDNDAGAIAGAISGAAYISPNDALKALSTLNSIAYTTTKGDFATYIEGGWGNEREEIEQLINLILEWTKYPNVEQGEIIRIVSAITVDFFGKNQLDKAAYLKAAKSQKLKTFISDWKKSKNINFEIDGDKPLFFDALKNKSVPIGSDQGDAIFSDIRAENNKPFVNRERTADYSLKPSRYLRTNMSSSDGLIEFNNRTGDLWIIPTQNSIQSVGDDEKDVLMKSGFYQMGGLFKSFDAVPKNQQSFTPRQSTTTSLNTLLNFGAPFINQPSETRSPVPEITRDSKDTYNVVYNVKTRYFGPWSTRWAFSNEIASLGIATIFRILIQLRNHIDTHLNLADYGVELMNFLIFRPFIEFEAKSVIIMNAGPHTMLTPFSRPNLMVTRDPRGEVHVSSEFYTATVVAIPENIRMLYACMPHRWRGGKNTTTMTHRDQWHMDNPDKPSLVIIPTPWTERKYKSPINMTNAPSSYRPGVDTEIYYRKHSSARFYETVFGERETGVIEALQMTRTNYWKHVPVHHVGHIGPRTFPDRNTLELIDLPGHGGPGTHIRMNIPGAEKTSNGEAYYYPHVVPNINVNKRHM